MFLIFLYSSRLRPDLLDFESLKKCNAHYNLQNAFNLAEKELGLTKLLDPEGGQSSRTRRCAMETVGLSLGSDDSVLELDGGDGCTALRMC